MKSFHVAKLIAKKYAAALFVLSVLPTSPIVAQETAPKITIDNFVRAETDNYFRKRVAQGALGKFVHDREPTPVDRQPVIRMNRDTPYSVAIFDLTNPVTIEKPDTGDRFQSMLVVNEDHYLQRTIYEPDKYTFTQEEMGTRYIQVNLRTFVNADDPADIAELRRIQDSIKVTQKSPGEFVAPDWDVTELANLRKAILATSPWVPDSSGMFGRKDEVDPVRHLIGTAGGFGGNKRKDAIYLNVSPEKNDGQTPHVLTVKDVPVDGFWSVIVYNKDGFFEAPAEQASVNNVSAQPAEDGTITIHFGGDPDAPNYLRIMAGWSYMVRLYRPRTEILDGTWAFPKAKASLK
ncbi:DUF1214 domain-containing protein [Stratiformator vulcanicus]|uniref:DUF1254 domain-containing protein n=1 Tax=Stratiformator vulcanicus TaxID=2527980 RepID=A0A517R720_9PLAN|nr:DUF1214 domain-containing protein [Stratiformator vulcanicus]QDT39697.1 hypothetical protein Pan189_41060 [Stratiformator vulcanicus]